MTRQRLPGAERRHQIADAALRILADRGATQLTALTLAREVGVADATLFRHFPSMDAIVDAAIGRFGEALESSLDRPEATPVTRLRAFFLHRFKLLRARPELLRLAFNDRLIDAASGAGSAEVRAIVNRSRSFVQACLLEGRATGEIRSDLPPRILFLVMSGVMRGAALSSIDGIEDPSTPEELWDCLWRLLAAAPLQR